MDYASKVIPVVLALAAVASAIYAYRIVKRMKNQMEQFTDHELTRQYNEHNWNLYVHREGMPPALPPWRQLSDKGWAWRALHFNHLNLLKLAYSDHQRGLLNKKEFEARTQMAKFWFSDFWSKNPDDEIKEGRETLRQVLKAEEGYPNEFREWLRKKGIIPSDLFSS